MSRTEPPARRRDKRRAALSSRRGILWAAPVGVAGVSAAMAQEAGGPPGGGGGFSVAWPIAVLLALGLAASLVILLRLWQNVQRMARQHRREKRTLIDRSNELEATLSSMVEGVLAVDLQQRVLSVNDAAAMLLSAQPGRAAGRHIDEVIDEQALRRFIAEALESDRPTQADVELPAGLMHGSTERERRLFQAQGAVLRDTEGRRIGSLIVLHDVTRLRRLEVVRRDFVANASHEIKTPVTTIKAAAETLLEDGDDPEATRQFVGVIARQSDRLQSLVEDLLSLARIEEDTEQLRVPLEPKAVAEVLNAAAEACDDRAEQHEVQIQLDASADLLAPMNAPLIEQAVVNLLDNAIKYGGDGSTVRLTAERVDGEVIISVSDEGPGIAPEHQGRIFERFYRTDKARSRRLGGTGLGLSIVRHIALAHRGYASVQSEPGSGSKFRLHIPLE